MPKEPAEPHPRKYQKQQSTTWVQNQNLFSNDNASPHNVMSYWRYVLKREQKARKYHLDLNQCTHTPYYNSHIPQAHQHKSAKLQDEAPKSSILCEPGTIKKRVSENHLDYAIHKRAISINVGEGGRSSVT